MRPIKLTLLLFVFSSIMMKAQYSGFDLSRYKLPDIKQSRLDAYLDFSNIASSRKSTSSNVDTLKSRYQNNNGNLNLNYYYIRNTESYQGQLNANASGALNNYSNKNDDSNSSSYNNNINFVLSNINRFYRPNMNFIEVDPELSVLKSKVHSDSPYSNNYTTDQFTTVISLPISVGHGRIEPVQDLRLAIYILEELNKAGRIKNLPTDEVLLEMAKETSKIKSQRFFDARIKKIKELQVVDSFLVANNIVSSNDITYFAVLNDQWSYASGPERTSGFAVNFGIDDRVNIDRTQQENFLNDANPGKTETAVNSYFIAGFSQVRYDKPINLYWQTSAILKVSYGFEFIRDQKNKDIPDHNYRTDIFNTILSYSIQFIPNSRTSAELSLSGIYSNLKSDRTYSNPISASTKNNGNDLKCSAGININYYFSPQFRIRLNSDLGYTNNKDRNSLNDRPSVNYLTTSLQNYFSLSLIYSFF